MAVGVLKPETKLARVLKAELEAKRKNKKAANFEANRTRLREALAKLTDEEGEKRQKDAETANKAVDYLSMAPTTDDDEYERLLAEKRAEQADAEDADDDEDSDAS